MHVFYSIQNLFKQEKSFQWNPGTLHAQINASGLIILTHEPSVHAGRKAEYREKKKQNTQTEGEHRKFTQKDPANAVPRTSVLWGNSANDCTAVLQSA